MTHRQEITLITPDQAADIRARVEKERAYLARVTGGKRNYLTRGEVAARLPSETTSNDEKGALEQFEILRDLPDRLFVYVGETSPQPKRCPGEGAQVRATVWTGHVLGYGTWGQVYRDNFGGRRRPIWVRINGVDYVGTAFVSAGDYARLRKCKRPLR